MAEAAARKRRSGGRAGNKARRSRELFKQMPWRVPLNTDRPIEPLDEGGVQAIHDGAMRILEEIGLEIVNERARALMVRHGARLDPVTGYVQMDRDMVMEIIDTVPSRFTLHARNPVHNSVYGDNYINFALVASPPNCSDLDRGRRSGTQEDFRRFL